MTVPFGQSASLADTLENRPAPDPDQIGRYYHDTETGQLYRDYGTIWQPVLDKITAQPPLDLNANYEWKGAHHFDATPQVHHALQVFTTPTAPVVEFDTEIADALDLVDGYENLQGVSAAFSDGGVLYMRVEDNGGAPPGYHLRIYSLSRCAVGDRVGVTEYVTESGPTTVTEENESGLSGTLNLIAGQLADDPISARWTITTNGLPPFPSTPVLDDFNRATEGPPPGANWSTPSNADAGLTLASGVCVPPFSNDEGQAVWTPLSGLQDTEVFADTVANPNCLYYRLALYTRIQNADNLESGCYALFAYFNPPNPTVITLDIYYDGDFSSSQAIVPWVLGDSFGLRVITESSSLMRLYAYHKPAEGAWVQIHSFGDTVFKFASGGVGMGITGNDSEVDSFSTADNFGGGTVTYGASKEIFNTDTLTGITAIAQLSTPSTAMVTNLNAEMIGGRKLEVQTGVPITAAGVHAALVALGLITE